MLLAGNLLGLLLSPLILSAFGWRALFYVFGLFGLPLLAMWLAAVPNGKPSSANNSTPIQHIASSSREAEQNERDGSSSSSSSSSTSSSPLRSSQSPESESSVAGLKGGLEQASNREKEGFQAEGSALRDEQGGGGQRTEGGASTSAAATQGEGVSVVQLMSKSATWAIIVVNIVNHFGYFIYLNWMPTYFVKVSPCKLQANGRTSEFLLF